METKLEDLTLNELYVAKNACIDIIDKCANNAILYQENNSDLYRKYTIEAEKYENLKGKIIDEMSKRLDELC